MYKSSCEKCKEFTKQLNVDITKAVDLQVAYLQPVAMVGNPARFTRRKKQKNSRNFRRIGKSKRLKVSSNA